MGLELRIRELRKRRGLTLAALADKVGVSIPHLSEVERGKKNLNNHLMVRISTALHVEPRDLLAGDASLADIDQIVANLPDVDKKRVLDFALALRDSQGNQE